MKSNEMMIALLHF